MKTKAIQLIVTLITALLIIPGFLVPSQLRTKHQSQKAKKYSYSMEKI